MYPNEDEVRNASHYDLCHWWRYLPSPGLSRIGEADFKEAMAHEAVIMNLIQQRLFGEFGGFTPEISKAL